MTDPRTLSELVPAQTLAKALLEAEALLIMIDGKQSSNFRLKAPRYMHEAMEQNLAQIQRIKKGEMV